LVIVLADRKNMLIH